MTWIRSSLPVMASPAIRASTYNGNGSIEETMDNPTWGAENRLTAQARRVASESDADNPGIGGGVSATRSAEEDIQRAIGKAISECQYAELRWIEYRCWSQKVVLHGNVSSFFMKQMAQEIVRKASPSLQIENRLQVAG